uniref:THAP-type domain-containing protein n=1 Tax=Neogobius melanostomus TaxID=47308 RepID=A0A8C6TVD4_9GOBI
MVKRCAYGVCKSDTRYPQSVAGVKFYPFPKPKTKLQDCLQWIKQCGRPYYQLNVSKINKHTYVCSKHFVNGRPTPEYPNPIPAVQAQSRTIEQFGGSGNRRKFVVQEDSSSTSSIPAEESQQQFVSCESPEHPPLPGCQLEPEEEKNTVKKKTRLEEENNMKLQLSLKETEIESLKAQISTLIKRTLTPELLESSEIPQMLEHSTGFTYETFNQMCTLFCIPNDPHTTQINVPLKYKRNDWQVAEMPLRSQLLFTLMKLRNNEDLQDLAFRFNINMQTASNIFNSWIHYMFYVLGEIPIWPHRDVITLNMPKAYKADYPSTFAILDCTELHMERPRTLKSLVACDPRGGLIFSSALFTGFMSAKEMVRRSGLIPLLEKLIDSGYLQRGDGIMADKGFLIEEEMEALGLQLNLPPCSRPKGHMPVTKHSAHVARAIAKIKKFKIVSDKIPNTRLGIINQIWYVVSMLSNFQPNIQRQ